MFSRATKVSWDAIKLLKKWLNNFSPPKQSNLNKPDGTACKTPEENAATFHNHFKSIFSQTPTFDTTVVNLLPQHNSHLSAESIPSDDEIQAAITNLNNTVPGPSGIRSSIRKTLAADDNAFALLRDFVHKFWNT